MSGKIHIHSIDEINKMKVIGKITADILTKLGDYVKEGVTTQFLDEKVNMFVEEANAKPALKGYMGFPSSICTSINHVVCHGIPSKNKILKRNDIINVDVTLEKDGYHGDSSKMFIIGKPTTKNQRLVDLTYKAMWEGIKLVKPGINTGLIGHTIEKFAKDNFLSSVHDYCGHGIGKTIHQSPEIRHFGKVDSGIKIKEGMIFTIEPMLNLGKKDVKTLSDGWTVVTKDKTLSAQWEHTILVTKSGYEVLTLRDEEVTFL